MRTLFRTLTHSRRAWLRIVLTTALAALCLILAARAWYNNHTSAETALSPLSDPLANDKQLGLNVDLQQYEPGELDRVLAQIEGAGFRWVRQRFPWPDIEPTRATFQWATWDAIVAACASHHLALIAVLDGSPAWARPGAAEGSILAPPEHIADWGTFAARVALRYRGQVAAYQVWDEPNLSAHWGGRYVDPTGYAALLREGAIGIRQADPGAAILLAALAPTVENGPLNLNEVSFLRQVMTAGAGPFFDVVALQPYGFGDPPEAGANPARLNWGRVAWVRRDLVRLGLGERPVWGTAWGWNALPADWAGQPSVWPSVSPAQQAEYTLNAVRMARQRWPWMGPLILYTYQPHLPANDPHWGFALVDGQGQAGPLLKQLADYQASRPPLGVGTYVPGLDNVRATTGEWRFSSAGADPPAGASAVERNAVLAFDVYGTALDVTVRRGAFWGLAYVEVDGRPAQGLPHDEQGRSYLVLYDPLGQVERVNVAHGLSLRTPHHVEIVADGGWGQWPLVGWTVRQDQAPPAGAGTILLLCLAGGSALLASVAQIALVPGALQSLYRLVETAFRRYRALPEWVPVLLTLGTAAAFYFSPWTPLSLLFLLALFILVFLRIDLGLAVVALALPFYLQPKVLGRPFSIVELGLWLCAVAWVAARLLDLGHDVRARSTWQSMLEHLARLDDWLRTSPSRFWRGTTPLDKGMAALVLVAVLSASWARQQQVAARELRTVFVESALFYTLIRLAARSPRARWRVLEGWLLGATIIALVGIGQLLAGQNLISAEGVWRVRGLYGSPNNLALYLERAWPVLLAVAWQGTGSTRPDRLRRIAYGLAVLPVLAALILTQSKGALLVGLPSAAVALIAFQVSRRRAWAVAVALAVIALILLPLALSGRLQGITDLDQGTGSVRLKLWRSALAMIADHPLTGVGLDNFLYAYRTRYVLPSAWQEPDLSHPHNLILDTWTRLGVGGLAVMAWLLVTYFRGAWLQFRAATGQRRALLLGLLAAMVALLAHGMVDHAVYVVDLAFVFALLLAMVGR